MKEYNIPRTIHEKVMKRMKVENEEEYSEYLKSLEEEACTYISTKVIFPYEEIDVKQLEMFKGLYIQYTMFSKVEKEEVAQDKIVVLNELLESLNIKNGIKKDSVKKGVNFL